MERKLRIGIGMWGDSHSNFAFEQPLTGWWADPKNHSEAGRCWGVGKTKQRLSRAENKEVFFYIYKLVGPR